LNATSADPAHLIELPHSVQITRAQRLFKRPPGEFRAPVRCFCFPYAGANHTLFSNWSQWLARRVDVIPVILPGRGVRFCEAPYVEFEQLMQDLEYAIAPLLDQEFALFGHSLGALIAYELAHRLCRRDSPRPRHLFVSATRAPHVPQPASALLKIDDYKRDDAAFARILAANGGIPHEWLNNEEIIAVVVPAIRADFRLYESYKPCSVPEQRAVTCPITAFGGLADTRDVPEPALREWARYTRSSFDMHMFAGDHFFLHTHPDAITDHIRDLLERL
jgi:medium-chain acyl-[acyl-carrier-protein] hydrolase